MLAPVLWVDVEDVYNVTWSIMFVKFFFKLFLGLGGMGTIALSLLVVVCVCRLIVGSKDASSSCHL